MTFYCNLTSLDGKRGIFNIILTATILTIFELVFFYNVVSPGVNQQINTGLEKVSKIISDKIHTEVHNIAQDIDKKKIDQNEKVDSSKNQEVVSQKRSRHDENEDEDADPESSYVDPNNIAKRYRYDPHVIPEQTRFSETTYDILFNN